MAQRELVEARRRLVKAQDEAKKLKGALHKELGLEAGQAVPDKVFEDGWKGRAETIVLLRSKVKRLEQDLEAATGRRDPKVAARTSSGLNGVDVDRQAQVELAEMEEERRRATEQLTQDYAQVR